jgi:hypothetical protein
MPYHKAGENDHNLTHLKLQRREYSRVNAVSLVFRISTVEVFFLFRFGVTG